MAYEIGKVTAAAALREELEGTLARLTNLTEGVVRRRLRRATGNTHVRTVLEDDWPWDAERLGELKIVDARELGLVEELIHVTGMTRRTVRRRIQEQHGRTLLRNAFRDEWPRMGTAERAGGREEIDDEQGDGEGANPSSGDRAPARTRRASKGSERVAGRYAVGRRLGRGGFGEVFEAWDELAERKVVLKFATDDDISVLKHEYKQVFDLAHPHICSVSLQQDQITGRGFLVMQHGGESVEQRIRRRGAFDLDEAVEVVVAVAAALDFAHERKVIHHDVSPGNILLDANGVARLTDFGVALTATRRLNTRGSQTLLAGTALGMNRGYAAPEMYVHRARRASDQFSLATVFCSMIDGEVFANPPEFRKRRQLSAVQNRALERAMQLDPAQRFETCGDFAAALAGARERASKAFLT